MALLALLVSRLAGLAAWTTRLAAWLIGEPTRYLAGKAFERKLTVHDLPFRRLALANDAPIVETVLIDRHGTFPKSAVVTALLRPMIGAGLFGQAGGEAVRLARRLFIQALGRIGDAEVSRIAHALCEDYLARWRSAGEEVIVPRELSRLTVDIVAQAMLGHRFSPEESVRFVDLFFAYHKRAAPLLLVLAGRSPPALDKLVRQLGLEEIGAPMRALIAQRFLRPIAAGEPAASGAPFAKALRESANGSHESMLDEIAVMLLAGHETTASTLSWLLWELAGSPARQDAAAELLGGREAAAAEAEAWRGAAPAARRAALINETLRLYPPIAFSCAKPPMTSACATSRCARVISSSRRPGRCIATAAVGAMPTGSVHSGGWRLRNDRPPQLSCPSALARAAVRANASPIWRCTQFCTCF